MENKENINDAENSILNKIKKEGDFKIPTKYFDEFQNNVQVKTQVNTITWYQLPQWRTAFLGVSLTLLSFVLLFNYNKSIEVVSNELSNEEIELYFDEHLYEYNDAELIEEIHLDELPELEAIDSIKTQTDNSPDLMDELTEDDILEYLMEEGYDKDWGEL